MTFLTIVFIGVVIYFYLKIRSAPSSRGRAGQQRSSTGTSSARAEWLEERWEMAKQQQGRPGGLFPSWYFDPMTERQANRLDEDGKKYSHNLTKGQASDLIGMGEPADEDDLEVLRFFKQSTRGMNETRAGHTVALLFQQESNRQAWESRPATARQMEFFRFFGMKQRTGVSKVEAESLLRERLKLAEQQEDPLATNWRAYEAVLDEFDDPDFRETYDLRKPSYALIRSAASALLASGKTWGEIRGDIDLVVDKLIEMKPDLER